MPCNPAGSELPLDAMAWPIKHVYSAINRKRLGVSVEQMFRLDGRVALVSGASSPIGSAACDVLADAGATVACAARNVGKAEAVDAAIIKGGGKAFAMPI